MFIRGDKMKFYNGTLDNKNKYFDTLKQDHDFWKNELQTMNKPFFMIPTDFSHLFLKNISGGALKLYLFLGFHSKYRTGESWYTNEEISLFFEKDQRTISKWFTELETLGLIFRAQKGIMMKANTFLLPFGLFIDEEDIHFSAKIEKIENSIENKLSEYDLSQALILTNGIQDISLLLIFQEKDSNIYSVSCFFEHEFHTIKEIMAFFKKKKINIDSFEIDTPLSYSKYDSKEIYNILIRYFDAKSMWL